MASAGGATRWPVELRLKKAEKLLEISFDDGNSFRLPAEYLRVESPSAEVQGHGPGQRTLVSGRAHVGIIGLEPVGNYAVRIVFDDLHGGDAPLFQDSTHAGIFSWSYLHQLGVEYDRRWRAYIDALAMNGLRREPDRS